MEREPKCMESNQSVKERSINTSGSRLDRVHFVERYKTEIGNFESARDCLSGQAACLAAPIPPSLSSRVHHSVCLSFSVPLSLTQSLILSLSKNTLVGTDMHNKE